jgi:selenocysteine lyase/cysteine desulfurase
MHTARASHAARASDRHFYRPAPEHSLTTTRRQFLSRTSRTAAGFALGGALAQPPSAAAAPAAFDPYDWASVRAQFNLDPSLAHLSNFFLASCPAPVRDAIDRHRRALDENPYTYLDDHMFGKPDAMLWRNVTAAAAQYVGGQPNEIALTSSTTMGLALVYNGLSLKPGQEILTTTHDFYPHHESIRLAVNKWGGSMRKVALYEASATASADQMVGRLIAAIRPNTRVLGVTWVHSGTGVVLPIRDVAAALKHVNAQRDEADRVLLVVDGVHGFGVLDEDAAKQGSDFFSAGTHKWILGPHGNGIVWGRPESWALVQPTIPSLMSPETSAAWREGRAPRGPTQAAWVSPGGFFAYENQWATVEAFQFHRQIGRKRIADRIRELNGQLKEGLAAMRHVVLHTPRRRDLSAGFVCFEINGWTPAAVVQRLRERGVIASTTPYATSYARFSAGIVNSPADIERALSEVRQLA